MRIVDAKCFICLQHVIFSAAILAAACTRPRASNRIRLICKFNFNSFIVISILPVHRMSTLLCRAGQKKGCSQTISKKDKLQCVYIWKNHLCDIRFNFNYITYIDCIQLFEVYLQSYRIFHLI